MHLKLEGLIPILGGVYGLLIAYGVVLRHPKDPEKMALWHRKFGWLIKILCPFLIAFGFLELLGIL
jgi:hypothetical protein